jgi:hypothetical protein
MVRILDELNDEKMQAFSELLERNEEHKIAAFIEEHLPNFYDLVLEESMRVKLEMAELVKDLPQE